MGFGPVISVFVVSTIFAMGLAASLEEEIFFPGQTPLSSFARRSSGHCSHIQHQACIQDLEDLVLSQIRRVVSGQTFLVNQQQVDSACELGYFTLQCLDAFPPTCRTAAIFIRPTLEISCSPVGRQILLEANGTQCAFAEHNKKQVIGDCMEERRLAANLTVEEVSLDECVGHEMEKECAVIITGHVCGAHAMGLFERAMLLFSPLIDLMTGCAAP